MYIYVCTCMATWATKDVDCGSILLHVIMKQWTSALRISWLARKHRKAFFQFAKVGILCQILP